MPKVNNLLRWSNLLLIVLTLFSYLSPYVSPLTFWPLSFFGLIYPWLLLGNLLYILIWLVAKNRYFLFSFCCVLLGWGHVRSLVGFSSGSAKGETTETVSILTMNAHSFWNRKDRNRPITGEDLLEELGGIHYDIVCFQEFPTRKKTSDRYIRLLKEHSDMKHHFRGEDGGLVIFSRYPLLDKTVNYYPNRTNGYQQVDLEINGQKVRLFNIHLQSNSVTRLAGKVSSEGNLQEKETWINIRGMLGRFRRSVRLRASQAEEISSLIAESPYPVLVCGDFNDIPQSYSYHTLSRQLNDSFKEKGSGFGNTYSGGIPALRIDYILSDPAFEVVGTRVLKKSSFSDHYPVTSILKLD